MQRANLVFFRYFGSQKTWDVLAQITMNQLHQAFQRFALHIRWGKFHVPRPPACWRKHVHSPRLKHIFPQLASPFNLKCVLGHVRVSWAKNMLFFAKHWGAKRMHVCISKQKHHKLLTLQASMHARMSLLPTERKLCSHWISVKMPKKEHAPYLWSFQRPKRKNIAGHLFGNFASHLV